MGIWNWIKRKLAAETAESWSEDDYDLVEALHRQRNKFVEACTDLFNCYPVGVQDDLTPARRVASAFQVVRILRFVSAKSYLSGADYADFTNRYCHFRDDPNQETFRTLLQQFHHLAEEDEASQWIAFAEILGQAIAGNEMGAVAGTGLAPMAREFILRSWAITAYTFHDKKTGEELTALVLKDRA